MKWLVFAGRNTKEILRDPLTLGFGVGFPVILLLLLTLIQRNIPVALFELESLTPGIVVFGYSFLALFAAQLACPKTGEPLSCCGCFPRPCRHQTLFWAICCRCYPWRRRNAC